MKRIDGGFRWSNDTISLMRGAELIGCVMRVGDADAEWEWHLETTGDCGIAKSNAAARHALVRAYADSVALPLPDNNRTPETKK